MFILILFFLLFSSFLFSDQRLFVWTYQPMVEAPGEYELELYTTLKEGKANNNIWEHQIEIEAGISKGFDLSLYQVFEEKNNLFNYKGTKLKSRFMPYDRGKKIVDFVAYLEYFKNKDFELSDKIEAKAILGKRIGNFEWAGNLTVEYKFEPKNEFEYALNFAFTKALINNVYIGFEAFGIFEESEESYYLGPTISIGEHKLWASFNYSFGLNDESDTSRARLLIGINLN